MSTLLGHVAALTNRTELRRRCTSEGLDAGRRAALGQYFTPGQVADFIASLVELPAEGKLRVLDPGAGVGSLTAALVAYVIRKRPGLELEVTACEIDEGLVPALNETLDDCRTTAEANGVLLKTNLIHGDYIEWAGTSNDLLAPDPDTFDLVLMNPPYGKINKGSRARTATARATVDTPNLYAAFLALAVSQLSGTGQLIAITPRSFANGPYFKGFRRYFLGRMHLDRLHVFKSRTTVFADTDVLQENVIFKATRSVDGQRTPGPIAISSSKGYDDQPVTRVVPYSQVVHPDDGEHFIHISSDEADTALADLLAALPTTLTELSVQVSTGRVVDFRAKDHLRPDPEPGAIPLIYPLHMQQGRIQWPAPGAKKSNALALNDVTARQTVPAGHYVVVKRLSSKEERRRVVAAVFDPEDVPCEAIGFENHVNYFHRNNDGLPADLSRGLCLWLNSTLLDRFIRRFSGHTQINATDLRNLRYPSEAGLNALGIAWGRAALPDQTKIDSLVEEHIGVSADKLPVDE